MPRHKSLFTKTNYEKFCRLDTKTRAKKSLIIGIGFFVLGLFLLGIFYKLDSLDSLEILWIYPIGSFIFGFFVLFLSFFEFKKAKQEEIENKIYNEKLFNSNISTIDKMSGTDFERFCKVLFEKKGYSVETTKTSGDYGIDLILYKDGIKSVGQCKRYSDKVSLSAVQEVVAGMAYYDSNYGFIITNNFFTKPAIALAEANNIELIDRKELVDLICEIKQISDLEIPQIEKQVIKKEEKSPVQTFAQKVEAHNSFTSYAFEMKNEIAITYEKDGFDDVKKIINQVEEKSTNSNEDKITLHFFYQDVANILYSMRYISDSAVEHSLILCDKDIELLKTTTFNSFLSITSLTRKCIILEKQNKLKEAIEVCDFAIEHNFLDNKKPFTIRKAKLQNKLNNQ